jgi:hypothetical protein
MKKLLKELLFLFLFISLVSSEICGNITKDELHCSGKFSLKLIS